MLAADLAAVDAEISAAAVLGVGAVVDGVPG
jgi:hypothetical protein